MATLPGEKSQLLFRCACLNCCLLQVLPLWTDWVLCPSPEAPDNSLFASWRFNWVQCISWGWWTETPLVKKFMGIPVRPLCKSRLPLGFYPCSSHLWCCADKNWLVFVLSTENRCQHLQNHHCEMMDNSVLIVAWTVLERADFSLQRDISVSYTIPEKQNYHLREGILHVTTPYRKICKSKWQ